MTFENRSTPRDWNDNDSFAHNKQQANIGGNIKFTHHRQVAPKFPQNSYAFELQESR
ncbi:hypothetical protein BGP_0821 [Beggiatoa sp. PS]|nr:hypothetical protein BGP_0821 [Beggiatoa sp. PS]